LIRHQRDRCRNGLMVAHCVEPGTDTRAEISRHLLLDGSTRGHKSVQEETKETSIDSRIQIQCASRCLSNTKKGLVEESAPHQIGEMSKELRHAISGSECSIFLQCIEGEETLYGIVPSRARTTGKRIKERFDEVVKNVKFFSGDRWCFVVNGILDSVLQDGVQLGCTRLVVVAEREGIAGWMFLTGKDRIGEFLKDEAIVVQGFVRDEGPKVCLVAEKCL
jgi:hypothetical protein